MEDSEVEVEQELLLITQVMEIDVLEVVVEVVDMEVMAEKEPKEKMEEVVVEVVDMEAMVEMVTIGVAVAVEEVADMEKEQLVEQGVSMVVEVEDTILQHLVWEEQDILFMEQEW